MSILYVEDDPTIRESLSSLIGLRFPSLKVLTAENGQAGLKLYKETRADLVLTDISMPVMDGIRMAREIRRLNPEASIFALSGHSYWPDAYQSLFNRRIVKPFNSQHVCAAIADFVSGVIRDA